MYKDNKFINCLKKHLSLYNFLIIFYLYALIINYYYCHNILHSFGMVANGNLLIFSTLLLCVFDLL